jgi:hypothetical protein
MDSEDMGFIKGAIINPRKIVTHKRKRNKPPMKVSKRPFSDCLIVIAIPERKRKVRHKAIIKSVIFLSFIS